MPLETQTKPAESQIQSPAYQMWGEMKQAQEAIESMGMRHLSNFNELGEGIGEVTKRRRTLLYQSIFRHFLAEQGAARNNIVAGPGNKRETIKSQNRAFIANRAVLIDRVKDSSLNRLQSYKQKIAGLDQLSDKEIILQKNLKQNSEDHFQFQKILTVDISGLKQIDNAGEGDRALNDVALKMIEIADWLQEEYPNAKILAYRPGGDEFSFTIESNDPEELKAIIDYINTDGVNKDLASIQTKYATLDSLGNIVSQKTGPIQIKNGVTFDESRPEIEGETDDAKEISEIRALLYDIVLSEINLIPESSHIDSAFEDVESQEGDTLRDKFNNYFNSHWDNIVKIETNLPNFNDSESVSNEEVEAEVEKLCNSFPGLKVLFEIAIKTDKSLEDDINTARDVPKKLVTGADRVAGKHKLEKPKYDIHVRETLQLVSKFMLDPVLGEKVYNKHAFDQLVEYKQLSGLVIFKEVIKGINDKLGLVNGDAVIRTFYETIKDKIPKELEKYIVYGRGQADILIGFNTQAVEKLGSEEEKNAIITQINALIDELQAMSSFNCQINKGTTNLDFKLNMGVGAAKLDKDGETGSLKPPKMSQCYDLAETDFNLKYLQKLPKWNINELSEVLFNWTEKTAAEIEQIRNSDPDLWNFAIMLNDPKRAVLNSSKLLNTFKDNLNSSLLDIIPQNQKNQLLESLTLYTKKAEIKANIKRLKAEIVELGINGWDIFKRLKKGLKESDISQLEMGLVDNNRICQEFLQKNPKP